MDGFPLLPGVKSMQLVLKYSEKQALNIQDFLTEQQDSAQILGKTNALLKL